MANTSMNIRMDSEVKKQAEELFSEIGMNMTTAINIFLKQAIRQNGIPFELKINVSNEITKKALIDAENGVDMYGPYDTVEDLMEALNA